MKTIILKLTRASGAEPRDVYVFLSHVLVMFPYVISPGIMGTTLKMYQTSDTAIVEQVIETVQDIRKKLLEMDCGAVLIEDISPLNVV